MSHTLSTCLAISTLEPIGRNPLRMWEGKACKLLSIKGLNCKLSRTRRTTIAFALKILIQGLCNLIANKYPELELEQRGGLFD